MTLVSKFSGSSSGASGDSDMVMMNRPRWRYQNYKNVWGPYFPLSDMCHIQKTFRLIPQATENGCKCLSRVLTSLAYASVETYYDSGSKKPINT